MSKTPQFEIPTDMRKMTEQSMEQVRTAINGCVRLFQSRSCQIIMPSGTLIQGDYGAFAQ